MIHSIFSKTILRDCLIKNILLLFSEFTSIFVIPCSTFCGSNNSFIISRRIGRTYPGPQPEVVGFNRTNYFPCKIAVALSTSSLLPIMSGVRSCRCPALLSSMRIWPSVAAPPACSAINARGAASQRYRSLPFGLAGSLVSAGYI